MSDLDVINFGTIISQLKKLEGKLIDLNVAIKELNISVIDLNNNFLYATQETKKYNKWLKGLTITLVVLTVALVILEAIPRLIPLLN